MGRNKIRFLLLVSSAKKDNYCMAEESWVCLPERQTSKEKCLVIFKSGWVGGKKEGRGPQTKECSLERNFPYIWT